MVTHSLMAALFMAMFSLIVSHSTSSSIVGSGPVITSISGCPDGSTTSCNAGMSLVFIGQNLYDGYNPTTVVFGNYSCAVLYESNTYLSCTLPSINPADVGVSMTLFIHTGYGSINTNRMVSYSPPPLPPPPISSSSSSTGARGPVPVVTSVSGCANGTTQCARFNTLSLYGSNLYDGYNPTTVVFGNYSCSVLYQSSNYLNCTLPSINPVDVGIPMALLIRSGYGNVNTSFTITYGPGPSPPQQVSSSSSSTGGSGGLVPVVTSASGTGIVATGYWLSIEGSNLCVIGQPVSIVFSNYSCYAINNNLCTTSLGCTLPDIRPLDVGVNFTIYLSSPAYATNQPINTGYWLQFSGALGYLPRITSVSGCDGGTTSRCDAGRALVFTGQNLYDVSNPTTVVFGNYSCAVLYGSSTYLSCTLPSINPVDVGVSMALFIRTRYGSIYTYRMVSYSPPPLPPPPISSSSSSTGGSGGLVPVVASVSGCANGTTHCAPFTTLSLYGSNLYDGYNPTTVVFGNYSCSVLYQSSNYLNCTLPSISPADVGVSMALFIRTGFQGTINTSYMITYETGPSSTGGHEVPNHVKHSSSSVSDALALCIGLLIGLGIGAVIAIAAYFVMRYKARKALSAEMTDMKYATLSAVDYARREQSYM